MDLARRRLGWSTPSGVHLISRLNGSASAAEVRLAEFTSGAKARFEAKQQVRTLKGVLHPRRPESASSTLTTKFKVNFLIDAPGRHLASNTTQRCTLKEELLYWLKGT